MTAETMDLLTDLVAAFCEPKNLDCIFTFIEALK
jgi:hypothetical protein